MMMKVLSFGFFLSYATVVNAGVVRLTALDVTKSDDIANAIRKATNDGTTKGRVILDGIDGPIDVNGPDSIPINVSNIAIVGQNDPVIVNCGNGFFFYTDDENVVLENIRVIGIGMACDYNCFYGPRATRDVVIRGNFLHCSHVNGVILGDNADDWLVANNKIVTPNGQGLRFYGGNNIVIRDNVIHSVSSGIVLDYFGSIIPRAEYSNVVIKSNRIFANDNGIEVGTSTETTILKNDICVVHFFGVYFAAQDSKNSRVEFNRVFTGYGDEGVVLGAVPKDNASRIRNNEFAIQACDVP